MAGSPHKMELGCVPESARPATPRHPAAASLALVSHVCRGVPRGAAGGAGRVARDVTPPNTQARSRGSLEGLKGTRAGS